MTKRFCDLCGAPAMETWPEFTAKFPNEDSEIQPRIVFDAHQYAGTGMPNIISGFHPDLCGNCLANLLRKMADTISVNNIAAVFRIQNNMSDNLKLGQIITTKQQRDAIHVAVAPIKAGEMLQPGQRIGVINGDGVRESTAIPAIGIVDPYLRQPVRIGQTFWLFLFPGTITALRHEWTHPAFAQPMEAVGANAVLTNIATKVGCSYLDLLSRLDIYAGGSCSDDDSIHEGLNTLQEEWLINLMWDAYESVRETKVSPELKNSTYFACAC